MNARVSLYEVPPGGDVDAAVKGFEDAMEPLRSLEGHQGATLLVSRDSGMAITITYWDTEENLRSSVEQANKLRQGAAEAGGLSIQSVDHYEVALDTR
jgi:heme-degrading monooxygenase HmoA